jgi:hypothetical protein
MVVGRSRERRGGRGGSAYPGWMHLSLAAVVVEEYDPAIEFFTEKLGFELVEDSPARTLGPA